MNALMQYQRCECHECTQARYRMQSPFTTGQWSSPQQTQTATFGQCITQADIDAQHAIARQAQTAHDAEIRQSIQKQLQNS